MSIICECQNCDWSGPADDLDCFRDVAERVAPGEAMPAGECPNCGALAHETDRKVYTVLVAFHDADNRAEVEVEAKSYEEACQIAIQQVNDGEVTTQVESYDPGPTWVYGVIEGDGDVWGGATNVPHELSESGIVGAPPEKVVNLYRSALGDPLSPQDVYLDPMSILQDAREILDVALESREAWIGERDDVLRDLIKRVKKVTGAA